MKIALLMLLAFLILSCNTQPIEVTVKMDYPKDSMHVPKLIRDTVYIGKLKPLEALLLGTFRSRGYLSHGVVDTFNYEAFPHKCHQKSFVSRIMFSTDNKKSDGVYGYVQEDTLRCNRILAGSVIKSWEVTRTGKVDTVPVTKGKFTLSKQRKP